MPLGGSKLPRDPITRAMAEPFFAFAIERHRIWIRRFKDEKPWPWTDDEILQKGRFCNIYRELDTTTQWFREHVREPLRDDPRVLMATILFRWFNRVETCQHFMPLFFDGWDRSVAETIIAGLEAPYFTGAYIIKSPNGVDKITGIFNCLDDAHARTAKLLDNWNPGVTLQGAHAELQHTPFLGPFMAYEVITDLRHTFLLEDAPDINTWASLGPGATRGLGRVVAGDTTFYRLAAKAQQAIMLDRMRELLELSRTMWPYEPWEMREVEHTLCEFDKYERLRLGEGRMKNVYTRPK